MNTTNVRRLGAHMRRFRARFVQGASGALSQLLPQADLEACVTHLCGELS